MRPFGERSWREIGPAYNPLRHGNPFPIQRMRLLQDICVRLGIDHDYILSWRKK